MEGSKINKNFELLFRGKDKDSGEFIEGFFYDIQGKEQYILQPCVLGLIHTEIEPGTVGMFTGVHGSIE